MNKSNSNDSNDNNTSNKSKGKSFLKYKQEEFRYVNGVQVETSV